METTPQHIRIENYTYHLDASKIANKPLKERSESNLLVYKDKQIFDKKFKDISDYIEEGSMVVFNNSKVIAARLLFKKDTGSIIECFCLEPAYLVSHEAALNSKDYSTWNCIIGNAKKWKEDQLELKFIYEDKEVVLYAVREVNDGQIAKVRFWWTNKEMTFADVLNVVGSVPLPPYIKRLPNEDDTLRYNTVYASIDGSVAAPTAGLHFTDHIIDQLKEKKVAIEYVTLHVGAGTFMPVKAENMDGHPMHEESIFIDIDLVEKIAAINEHSKLFTVGTTATRSLESFYWLAVKLMSNIPYNKGTLLVDQWEVYHLNNDKNQLPKRREAFSFLLNYMKKHQIDMLYGQTKLLILPGYDYKMVDALITNFHQPQSTLLLLIAGLVGESWRDIYQHAINNNYRFLSYGDSSLLFLDKTI